MNRLKITYTLACILALGITACDLPQGGGNSSNKKQVADQIATLGCKDVREFIVEYGGGLVPIAGKAIMDKIIKDKEGKGVFCDCMTEPVSQELNKRFTQEGLTEMISNATERRVQIAEIVLENRKDILACYQENGKGKGLKFLEKVFDKVSDNLEDLKDKVEEELED